MSTTSYLAPTQEAGRAYFSKPNNGPVIMLNLLKFREVADYSDASYLAPESPISGKEAYQLYMKHTTPFLEEAGSELIFSGKSEHFLIGPADESWDAILLVKHQSSAKFLEFAQNEGYLKIAGHRKAALLDSRLLPITEGNII